jgi:hypothetical protein
MKLSVPVLTALSLSFARVDCRGKFEMVQRGTGDGDKNQYHFSGDFRARGSNAEMARRGLKLLNFAMKASEGKSKYKNGSSSRKSSNSGSFEGVDSGEMSGSESSSFRNRKNKSFDAESTSHASFGSSRGASFDDVPDGFEEVRRTVRTRESRTVTTSGDEGYSSENSSRKRKARSGEKGYYRKYTFGVTDKEGESL